MRPAEPPPEDAPPGGAQQQPGFAPGPYQSGFPGQPTAPWPAAGRPEPGNRRGLILAAVAAVLLVAAVTGGAIAVLAGGDDQDGSGTAGASPSPSPGESEPGDEPSDDPAAGDPPPEDPRGGLNERPGPVVAEDWQVAVNAARGVAYDIPPDWRLQKQDFVYFVERDESIEADEDENPILVAMRSVGTFQEGWCGEWNPRSATGVRTRQGAADTAALAPLEAADWARAVYDQEERGTLEVTEGEPFTSAHGVTGHRSTATLTGLPEDQECPVGGAKAVVISYVTYDGDLATWMLVTDTGFEDEPDAATIEKIMNSLRPYAAQQQ